MQEPKVNIQSDGNNEQIVRTGSAAPIRENLQVTLQGIITSPKTFYELRGHMHEKDKCNVQFSYLDLRVNLRCDERDFNGHEVSGKMIPNPTLVAIGINQERFYSMTDLQKKLKFLRLYFKELDQYNTLINLPRS